MAPSPKARIRITTLGDPRVAPYRNQKDAWLRVRRARERGEVDAGPHHSEAGLEAGLFMAEGILVVEKLIRSSYGVHSILGTPGRLDALESCVALPGAPVYEAERPVMDGIAGFPIHRGLLACGRRGRPASVSSLLEAPLLVLLEDLTNHDNVGGIFRTVAALGGAGAGVVLSPRCCDPFYRKALRVSMGHVLGVPHARGQAWASDLRRIREAGFELLAMTPSAEAEELRGQASANGPARTALLIGSEGAGLSEAAIAAATRSVRISISPGVDSLNAVVAAAIGLDRLRRESACDQQPEGAGGL